VDLAEPAAGERQLDELQAVGKQVSQPVAGGKSLRNEKPRQTLDADGKLSVRNAMFTVDNGRMA